MRSSHAKYRVSSETTMVCAVDPGAGGHKPSTGDAQAESSASEIAAPLKQIARAKCLILGPVRS
ncbi:MAG: hypothetical protein OEV27_15250 [Nitrospira sp.]|nr:hypothetical protein [Nitrospira sp.]